MCELSDPAAVAAVTRGDALVAWAAQGMRGGVRVWARGGAVVVASPDLSRRDRLAVAGTPRDAAPLVADALAEVGPTFRPIGGAALVRDLTAAVPNLDLVGTFGWMETALPPPVVGAASWLDEAAGPEIRALLDAAFPDSYARPGTPRVRRWAGARDARGDLVAVAADAWSAPEVGFLATAPAARGRGFGAAVCAHVLRAPVAEHGRAALMVDGWNGAAIRLYQRLGLTWHPLAAARIIDER
jgi:GNAT superfamily N-acetyltransferase